METFMKFRENYQSLISTMFYNMNSYQTLWYPAEKYHPGNKRRVERVKVLPDVMPQVR
jgi:hypothetical protein